MAKMNFKVFENTEKMQEAYNDLQDFVRELVDKFQLTYFELWGILKAMEVDVTKSSINEE